MVCVGELILCLCTLCGYLFMKMGLCFLPVLLCGSFYARLCVLLSHCVRAKHVVCVCVCVCVCVLFSLPLTFSFTFCFLSSSQSFSFVFFLLLLLLLCAGPPRQEGERVISSLIRCGVKSDVICECNVCLLYLQGDRGEQGDQGQKV